MISAQQVSMQRVAVRLAAPTRTAPQPVSAIANLAAGAADLERAPGATALAPSQDRRQQDERPPIEERRQGERRKTKSAVLLDTRAAPRRQAEVQDEPHVHINVEA